MKRQEGIESRHGWKDAITVSDNIQHKIACGEKKVFGKAIQKLYAVNS